jgi:hypothetical protein
MATIDSTYIIVFDSAKSDAIEYACDRFKASGLTCEPIEVDGNASTRAISCPRFVLERTAASLRFLKIESATGKAEPFMLSSASKYANYSSDHFFEKSEELYLLYEAIRMVETDDKIKQVITNGCESLAAGSELIFSLKDAKIVLDVFPLHVNSHKNELWKRCLWQSPLYQSQMIDSINYYYGSKVALYFAWMRHYSAWLILPAIFGGTITFINHVVLQERTTDESTLTPIFSLFIIVWGALFMQYWRRSSADLCCRWGITWHEERDDVRPEFKGETRTSIVTGREERYYPYHRRLAKYAASSLVTGLMLLAAFLVMIVSLNLQVAPPFTLASSAMTHERVAHHVAHDVAQAAP